MGKCYLHHLIGGPLDGKVVPAQHRYEAYEMDGAVYIDVGEEPAPCEPGSWEAVGCCTAPDFLRVTMHHAD